MAKTGVIILAHGSRGEKAIVEIPEVLRTITEGVRALIWEGVEVVGAALQFNQPNLEQAVESLVRNAVTRIVIMPYFLFPGRHITEHIPQRIERLGCRYPGVRFFVANTLGIDELFIGLVAKRIGECVPELLPCAQASLMYPEDIEQQSMEIVARLVPVLRNMSQQEQAIVKRIVHAAGDPQVAHLVKFSPSAISGGINGVVAGGPIVTDVRMVAAGINKSLLETLGCSLVCALDGINWNQLQEPTGTRAALAIRHLGIKLNGAIVAIGNAPTALLTLLEMIDSGEVAPALVMGMPVGFVQAKESKDELMRRNIPYITIVGTRGGSAMAAAAVNALLRLAEVEHSWNGMSSIKSF